MVRAMAAAVTLGPAPGARQEKEGTRKEIILKRENLGFPRGSRLRQSINTLALQLPPIQLVLQAETSLPYHCTSNAYAVCASGGCGIPGAGLTSMAPSFAGLSLSAARCALISCRPPSFLFPPLALLPLPRRVPGPAT